MFHIVPRQPIIMNNISWCSVTHSHQWSITRKLFASLFEQVQHVLDGKVFIRDQHHPGVSLFCLILDMRITGWSSRGVLFNVFRFIFLIYCTTIYSNIHIPRGSWTLKLLHLTVSATDVFAAQASWIGFSQVHPPCCRPRTFSLARPIALLPW